MLGRVTTYALSCMPNVKLLTQTRHSFEAHDPMTRRTFVRGAVALAAVASLPVVGQPKQSRLPRIAFVFSAIPASQMVGSDPLHPYARAFIHKLRDLGLVEDRNVVIERRSAEGRPERIKAIMEGVVRMGVDVIVATGQAVQVAQRATEKIAIVGVVDDLLDLGLVDALNRPGRNVTAIGEQGASIHGKRVQLLKEAARGVSRVAVLGYRTSTHTSGWRAQLAADAKSLGVELIWVSADAREDLDSAFATILRERANGLYVTATHVNFEQAHRIADFAATHRLPTVGGPERAWLLSYDSDFAEKMRRAAVLTKKILDGARPADLPIEQLAKFSLVINLRTARDIGLSIPRSMLLSADEVVDR